MLLTEQFINGLNDNGMVGEILKKVATLEEIEDASSEHILVWACRVEVQKAQKSALHEIKRG